VSPKFVFALLVVAKLVIVREFVNTEIGRFEVPMALRTTPTLKGLSISPPIYGS